MAIRQIYVYPLWIRLWHVANALLCLVLIFTGFSMHFSSRDGNLVSFAEAVMAHHISGIGLSAMYLLFVAGNVFTSNGKNYRMGLRNTFAGIRLQTRYYFYGYFRRQPNPFTIEPNRKFNPLQLLAYVLVMYCIMPVMVVSGGAMMFAVVHRYHFFGAQLPLVLDMIHLAGSVLISAFLMIHIYFATLGHKPGSHFKSIVYGYAGVSDTHQTENQKPNL